MKQFLYSRLYGADKDFSYYIAPIHPVGPLTRAINSDRIPGKKKLLVLQNNEGVISFGVREQLTVRDCFNRPRKNFMGFQLELNENSHTLPFFDALIDKLSDITNEAHRCHEQLDQDARCGANLQNTSLPFTSGNYQAGNAWDEAVMKIRDNPYQDLLLMFDETGQAMALDIDEPQSRVSEQPEHRLGIQSSYEPPKQQSYSNLGIQSTQPVIYDDPDNPRFFVPPLIIDEPKKSGGLKQIFMAPFNALINTFCPRQKPPKSNIPFIDREDRFPHP